MSAPETATAKQPLMGRLEALTVLGIVGILAAALGVVAFAMPGSRTVTKKTGYQESGSFTYSAKARTSSVYGATGLRTGDPILTNVLGPVTTSFAYQLETHGSSTVHGTVDLQAVVQLDQGLSRSFAISRTRSFDGSSVTVAGTLPLPAIKAYINSTSAALRDVNSVFGATISVVPHVSVAGDIDGVPIKQAFAPELPFRLNGASTLTLASTPAADGSSTTAQLKPSIPGAVVRHVGAPRQVSLLVAHVSRHTAMVAGLGLAVLCLVMGLFMARPLLRRDDGTGASERIAALYGSQLTPVRELHLPDGPVADVSTMAALSDLAKQYESRIMHLSEEGRDTYLVWDSGIAYRYRSGEFPAEVRTETGAGDRLVVWPLVLPQSVS